MKKTFVALSIVAVLGLGSLTSGFPLEQAFANSTISSLKEKKEQIEKKQSEVNSQKKEKSSDIEKVQAEQKQINQEIKRIDLAVADTEEKIREKEREIEETDLAIKKLEEEIEILKERIEKRNELLRDRARSFQENGRVTYLDVLLGAQNFGDFIDRVSAVSMFVEADQNILREHNADKEELEAKQAQLKETLANLKQMQAELVEMRKTLSAQKAEKEKVMASLKKAEEQMHAEMLELEEEEALLAAQEKAMQRAIELEQKRLAELARQNNGKTPPVSDGTFTRPASGRLSSGFGSRSLGQHYGVDIAASGSVPIVAAADGVVIRSYYSSSYGNAIFISHSINGEIYTTVYAHLSSRTVSEGQIVSKGEQIGYMGNTGHSFGQHLHFELHRGPWNASKSNAINPVGIVPL